MSSDLSNLTNDQQTQVDSIVDIGNDLGLDNILIETAILIANAESDFNPNAAAGTTSASGLFQYTNGGWGTAWRRYLRDNPNGPLADQAADAVRNNAEAQIRAFYNELAIYNDRFPAVINPNFQNEVDQLVQEGYSPNTDIRQYAYLRHNTDVGQTRHIYDTAMTQTDYTDASDLRVQFTDPVFTNPSNGTTNPGNNTTTPGNETTNPGNNTTTPTPNYPTSSVSVENVSDHSDRKFWSISSLKINTVQVARIIIVLAWVYHGIFPKLLHVAPLELKMTASIGLSGDLSLLVTRIAGCSEILFGLIILVFYRSRVVIYSNIMALIALMIFVAIQLPEILIEAFNPVTTNVPLIGLSFILISQLKQKKITQVG